MISRLALTPAIRLRPVTVTLCDERLELFAKPSAFVRESASTALRGAARTTLPAFHAAGQDAAADDQCEHGDCYGDDKNRVRRVDWMQREGEGK
jgi:hypothetical protein